MMMTYDDEGEEGEEWTAPRKNKNPTLRMWQKKLEFFVVVHSLSLVVVKQSSKFSSETS